MLKSSLVALFLGNLYFNNINYIGGILFIIILLNLKFNENLNNSIKQIKFFMIFYITTSIFQIFFNQNGVIIYKIFGVYITEEGVLEALISFTRMLNLLLISWLISYKNLFSKFGKYQKIVEIVIFLVPEVIVLFRKRMRIRWFLRHIFKKIKEKFAENSQVVTKK